MFEEQRELRACLPRDAQTMRGDYCGHAFLKLGFAGSTTTACGAIAGTVALGRGRRGRRGDDDDDDDDAMTRHRG